MKTHLVLRYFIWSMLIFAVSMVLLSFRMLRPLELKVLDLAPRQRYGYNTQLIRQVEIPYATLPVYEQLSSEMYLGVARDAVRELKRAGAKVVIVPLPEYLRPSPTLTRTVEDILSDSIAVFGVPALSNSPYIRQSNQSIDERSLWWVNHPFYNRLKVPWGVMTGNTENLLFLFRFVPTGFRESNTGAPVPDVAVLALRRYLDIPGGPGPQLILSRLGIGPYTIPVERDGLSYVRYSYWPKNLVGVYTSIVPGSDSVRFYPSTDANLPSAQALKAAWQSYKGKIVFIDWNGARGYHFPNQAWAYTQFFGAVFNRSFVKVHNEWNALLITTLVVLLSVFSYTFRNGATVLVSLALSAASVVASIWLFDKQNILFEPIYILVPILLCGFVLPVVKLSGEKHIAVETIKSLEAENRRLLELKRSDPPGIQL